MLRMRHLLLAAAVLGSLLVSAAGFDFYKLSLFWPPSVCSTGSKCISELPNMFTIHGLWPQLEDDTRVPPYVKDRSCTEVEPITANEAMTLLSPIEKELKKYWPNLRLIKGEPNDPYFWRHEWEYHGMCSDYPRNPKGYFDDTVSLTKQYNPIEAMGITPGKDSVSVKKILENVKKNKGKYPQINCDTLEGKLQLLEIRFCFERAQPPSVLRDCPKKFDKNSKCQNEDDQVSFPANPDPITLESSYNSLYAQ